MRRGASRARADEHSTSARLTGVQSEVVLIYVALAVLVVVIVGWGIFGRRIRAAAKQKGRELGVDSEHAIKTGDVSKLSTVLVIGDGAREAELAAEALAANRRVRSTGDRTWEVRVVQPNDLTVELAGGRLAVVQARESLGIVMGGRDWTKILKDVETALAAEELTTQRESARLERSAAPIDSEHVWTVSQN